jgi:hypothetical protein
MNFSLLITASCTALFYLWNTCYTAVLDHVSVKIIEIWFSQLFSTAILSKTAGKSGFVRGPLLIRTLVPPECAVGRWCAVAEICIVASRKSISWYKFKITRPVKTWAIWGTFGPKLPCVCFTTLWPAAGSRRPNRAAVTHIGQKHPPGPLKLLDLPKKKEAKNTDFYFAP